MPPTRPTVSTMLRRGWCKCCPHCGRGPLFVRWITLHERCSACGLVYQRNQGDTWFFWVLTIITVIAIIRAGVRATRGTPFIPPEMKG